MSRGFSRWTSRRARKMIFQQTVQPLSVNVYYCTTWFTTDDVLFAEKSSPRYSAVIACVPTASLDFVSLATPPLTVAAPIEVAPSRNFTLPVGAGPALVTWAVKVTACPNCEGFGLEVRVVVVGYFSTTCVTLPVLGLKVASPGYFALMACVFALSADVLNFATPPAVVPVPIAVRPSKNVTCSP